MVAIGLPLAGQSLALAEVLADQAIEGLVAAPLPRVGRIGKEAPHAGCLFDLPVTVELGSVVPGPTRPRLRNPCFQDRRGIGRRCKPVVAEDRSAEIRTESLTIGRGRLACKAISRSGARAAKAFLERLTLSDTGLRRGIGIVDRRRRS